MPVTKPRSPADESPDDPRVMMERMERLTRGLLAVPRNEIVEGMERRKPKKRALPIPIEGEKV